MGNKMTQDQSKPDQDVENASSEGSSTDTSAQDTQEIRQKIDSYFIRTFFKIIQSIGLSFLLSCPRETLRKLMP